MKVTLEFYGRLKEQFSSKPIQFKMNEETASILDVYNNVCEQHNILAESGSIKPILNDTFANWDDAIKDKDVIGFFPPASGG